MSSATTTTTIFKYPNGTPMTSISGITTTADETTTKISSSARSSRIISIASYNLLAPLYIRPIDQRTGQVQPFASFEWISPEDSERILGDGVRLPKLLDSLRSCRCDFICVQELQLEREEEEQQQLKVCNGGKRSRSRQEEEEEGSNNNRKWQNHSAPFVLPKWIKPLVQNATSSGTTTTDCARDNNARGQQCYRIILPPQTELAKIAERNRRVLNADVAITNAIFYDSSKWNPVDSSSSSIAQGGGLTNTITCVTKAFVPAADDAGGTSDDERETTAEEDDPIVISSIHLDACSEERRVHQLRHCLERSLSMATTTPYVPPCIIAGDYNCELMDGSCVHAFLDRGRSMDYERSSSGESTTPSATELDDSVNRVKECAAALRLPLGTEPSREQMLQWDEMYNSVTKFIDSTYLKLDRVDTGSTRVAYDHDADSSSRKAAPCSMAQWRLDHILYTPSTLIPLGRWSTLEDDELSCMVGLPNDHVPSDHLPIAAIFERCQHPQLCDESRKEVIESMKEIVRRHEMELKCLEKDIESRRVELETRLRDKTTVDESAQNKKDNKKKPPPEIMEHVRNGRAAVKGLKGRHRDERHEFFFPKTILEKMVLQHNLGGRSCMEWVQTGELAGK